MLDSDEEDEGEGVAGETAVGGAGEPAATTPTGDDEDLSNDAENFSHVSRSDKISYRCVGIVLASLYCTNLLMYMYMCTHIIKVPCVMNYQECITKETDKRGGS